MVQAKQRKYYRWKTYNRLAMSFKEGFIEERLGALPSPWMKTHYRVPPAPIEVIEKTPEEFTDLLQYVKRPVNDQGNIGSCFPTETKVLMEDFTYKPIGKISVGEYVINHKGTLSQVTEKFKRKWQGRMMLIGVFGLPDTIECTLGHPFLTKDGWKKAEELTTDDYVFIPKTNKIIKDKTILKIESDPDFLWLLGVYLAEGTIYEKGFNYRVTFSLGGDEEDIAMRIRKIMNKYNVNVPIRKKRGSYSIIASFSGKKWVKLIKELCGKHSYGKHLAPRLMFLDPKLQFNIFRGWNEGDGHSRRGWSVAATTSEKLVWQMQQILLRNNLKPNIRKRKLRENRLQAWNVEVPWTEDNGKKELGKRTIKHFDGDNGFYVKIKSLEIKPAFFRDNVYNLEVDPEHTYIVDSIAVHNCVGHCGDTVMSLLHNKDGIYDSLSAGWLYSRSRYWANVPPHLEGSTNLGLMKALTKEGATTEECAPTDNVAPFTMYACGAAYEIAKNYRIASYHFVNRNPSDMKAAMYGLIPGFPEQTALVTAFPVYESFYEGIETGIVPMPKSGERLLGGHSSPLAGWFNIEGESRWINVGSWGEDAGDAGLFYLPMDYPFYDVELIKRGEPPEPKKGFICQLLEGLTNYFGCEEVK